MINGMIWLSDCFMKLISKLMVLDHSTFRYMITVFSSEFYSKALLASVKAIWMAGGIVKSWMKWLPELSALTWTG
ncbi:hypothetical protein TUM12147_45160 [Citrobacter europaeus]|nr:hypothetical protein TUM12147_45160 [Citrobacter europaeus]GIZ25518.1 hypothetical protein TUM12148_41820 [Citrobacter europaeus]